MNLQLLCSFSPCLFSIRHGGRYTISQDSVLDEGKPHWLSQSLPSCLKSVRKVSNPILSIACTVHRAVLVSPGALPSPCPWGGK